MIPGVIASAQLSGAGGWNPTALAGLQLWLAADAPGLGTGQLATLTDLSGSGHDATGQGSTKPTRVDNVVNGNPVIRFNGTTAYFSLPNYMTGLTASTWFHAIKTDADPPGAGGQTGIFWMSNSGNDTHYPWTDGSIYVSYGRNNRYSTNPVVALNSWHRLIITADASSWKLYINGTAIITQGASTVSWPTAPKVGKSNGGFYFDGDWLECGQYDSVLNGTDLTTLDAYLAARLGM